MAVLLVTIVIGFVLDIERATLIAVVDHFNAIGINVMIEHLFGFLHIDIDFCHSEVGGGGALVREEAVLVVDGLSELMLGLGKVAQDRLMAYAEDNQLSLYDALKKAAYVPGLGSAAMKAAIKLVQLFENWRGDMLLTAPADIFNKILNV